MAPPSSDWSIGALRAARARDARAFVRRLDRPLPRRAPAAALVLGVLASAGLIAWTPDALEHGDAAVYAQSIADRDLTQTTVHIGYYLLGIGLTSAMPLPPDRAMNVVSAVCAGLSVACIFVLAVQVTRKPRVGVVAVALLLTHDMFVRHALFAEVYGPETALTLLTLTLWLARRPLTAGVSLALAVLISPTAVFVVPALYVLRPDGRRFASMVLPAAALWALAILPNAHDYFRGPRGLLKATGTIFSPSAALTKEGFELVFGFFAALPLILFGAIAVARSRRLRVLGQGLAALWVVSLLLGERFPDVPVQLPTYACLCVLGGIGFEYMAVRARSPAWGRWWPALGVTTAAGIVWIVRALPRGTYVADRLPVWMFGAVVGLAMLPALATVVRPRRGGGARVAACALVVTGVLLNGWMVAARTRDRRADVVSFRDAALGLRALAAPDAIVVSEWSRGILYEHYAFGRFYTPNWINMEWVRGEWGIARRETSTRRLRDAIDRGTEIWLLRPFPELADVLTRRGYHLEPLLRFTRARVERPTVPGP